MKVALIGYGDWAKLLEKYLEASTVFNLQIIYSRSIKNHLKGTTDLNAVLNSDIQAVFLAVPIANLVNYTEQFLDAKKHVFCEKPLATNPKVVSKLYNLAYSKNVVLYVNYIYTQSPSINYLKSNLESVGVIKSLNFNLKQFGKFYGSHNAFEILGCHMFAVYFYFFENINIEKQQTSFKNLYDGKIMYLHMKNKHHQASFTADLMSVEKQRSIQIIGDKGMLYFSPLLEKTVSFYHKNKDDTYTLQTLKSFDESNNIENGLNYFYESVKGSYNNLNETVSINVSNLLNKAEND